MRSVSAHVLPITVEEGQEIMPIDYDQVEVDVTLDSGACDHVMDAEDAPGYTVRPSQGSRIWNNFVVGDGRRVRGGGGELD